MSTRRLVLGSFWLLASLAAGVARGQAPATPSGPRRTGPATTAPAASSSAEDPARIRDPTMPLHSSRPYRSRTAPQPRYTDPDDDYGFRNPGGVGRMNEFYPPGNKFENGGRDPVKVAQFGSGSPALSNESQMQAQRIGIARSRELHEHIDRYSRPMGGWGYGYGFGYGFGARFPY